MVNADWGLTWREYRIVIVNCNVKTEKYNNIQPSEVDYSKKNTFVLRTGKRISSPLTISYFLLASLISGLAPLWQHGLGLSMGRSTHCIRKNLHGKRCLHDYN